MAVTVNGNTIYIDASGSTASLRAFPVDSLILSSTGSAGTLTLRDASSSTPSKARFNVAGGETLFFDFSGRPMYFPNGLDAVISNCVATLIYHKEGSQ